MFILLFDCLCSDRYSAKNRISQLFCRISYCLKIYKVLYNFFSVFVSLFFEALVSLYSVDVTDKVPGVVFMSESAFFSLAFCYFVGE